MSTIQLPDGSSSETTSLDFEAVEETWNEYELEDGTTIKVKLVLNGVHRVEGQYDEFGQPSYVIQSNNQVRVLRVPDELMQNHEDADGGVERGVE